MQQALIAMNLVFGFHATVVAWVGLPLPLAGEGRGEGRIHSFPRWGKAGMEAVAASCLGGVLGLRQEVGFRPDSRPHFFCVAKRNEGKKRRALQAACPAELPSLLRRSGQTGSRKSDFFMSKHASLTAGVRGGTSAVPCTPSPACGRGLGRGLHFTHSPAGGRWGWGPLLLLVWAVCLV